MRNNHLQEEGEELLITFVILSYVLCVCEGMVSNTQEEAKEVEKKNK